MFSRYLYAKVKQCDSKFTRLILTSDEISFLKNYGVEFHRVSKPNVYEVNCDNLKELFC